MNFCGLVEGGAGSRAVGERGSAAAAAAETPYSDPRMEPKFQKGVPKLQYTTAKEWNKKGKGVLVQQLWARPGVENLTGPMTQQQLARNMRKE